MTITLSEAVKRDRLMDFIAQEEARGIGPASPVELDEALSRLIKGGQSEDQTSRSSSVDGSTGTKTR